MAYINGKKVLQVLSLKDEQTKTVALNMASGDQEITPDANKTLSKVTVTKPDTLIAGNIKNGVTIGGVTGNYSGEAAVLQSKTVSPTTSQQDITADTGYDALSRVTVNAVTSSIDANIQAGNIKSGVSILGVNGSVVEAKDEETKTVTLDLLSGDQTVSPTTNKVLSQVIITKPASLLPTNIKKDVNIAGVIGSLEAGITPTGNINLTNTTQTDVTNYATAQVVDANLVAGNIKNGVSILGVVGTALTTTITVNQDNTIDLTIA